MTIKEEREFKKPSLIKRTKDWFSRDGYLKKAFANKIDAARKTAATLLMIAVAGQFTVGALGIGAAAGDPAQMDGSLAVLNSTQQTDYSEDYINANVDDVVMFQLAIHNTEPPASGTDAYNVNAHITLPTNTGTNLVAEGQFGGSNTNMITDIAAVHTQVPAHLEYIPGSAEWTYNAGTDENQNWVTQTISDNLVTSGVNLGTVHPCWNQQQTVRVLARVTGSYLDVQKQVAHLGDPWGERVNAEPGDRLAFMITFTNNGNTSLHDVLVGDNLPSYLTYVPGTTTLYNPNHPNGISQPDDYVVSGRLNVGDYGVGSGGSVVFQVDVDEDVPAGCHEVRNVGIVDSDETPEFWDYAYVNVCGIEEQAPEFVLSKRAYNVTQDVNATSVMARAGDIITYTLSTRNVGDEAGSYTVTDNISDILEYADVINTGGGTVSGGVISYAPATIGIGQTLERTFDVRVRPLNTWPDNGDRTLTNIYGNQVVITVGYIQINLAKSAFNNTQNVNATTTVARAGDEITYTLITANVGTETALDYVISDDISDVLEYANVTDLNGATLSGGVISWPAQDIDPGEQVTSTFGITVKSPIPTNPQVGTSYDHLMDNTYGNDVRIRVETPVILGGVIAGASVANLAAAGANNILIFGLAMFMFSSSLFLYLREKYLLMQAMKLA